MAKRKTRKRVEKKAPRTTGQQRRQKRQPRKSQRSAEGENKLWTSAVTEKIKERQEADPNYYRPRDIFTQDAETIVKSVLFGLDSPEEAAEYSIDDLDNYTEEEERNMAIRAWNRLNFYIQREGPKRVTAEQKKAMEWLTDLKEQVEGGYQADEFPTLDQRYSYREAAGPYYPTLGNVNINRCPNSEYVGWGDEGIFYFQWPADLEKDISELDTIDFDPAMWEGPGWYQYLWDENDVQYLGAADRPEGH